MYACHENETQMTYALGEENNFMLRFFDAELKNKNLLQMCDQQFFYLQKVCLV